MNTKYKNIINKFSKKNILVVGDIILDRYIEGSVKRISPEAPVPVVLEEKFSYRLGGAANVAHNLAALGAKVTQVGKIGSDFEGQILKREIKRKGIDVSGIFPDKKISTIIKTRILAQRQQIVRIDKESPNKKGDAAANKKIMSFLSRRIEDFDAVIISDYGKGLVFPELINFICPLALSKKKIITVDPKVENFGYYKNVSAITPNKQETENAIRNIKITQKTGNRFNVNQERLNTVQEVDRAAEQLLKYLKLEALLVTLGEQGMRLYEQGKKPFAISTVAREVFDVTGAGDAVISVYTLSLASKATKRQAAELSNIAAGVVVGKMGAVAVTQAELSAASKG